jgi:geranylgeranyl pyrophosphate synthase
MSFSDRASEHGRRIESALKRVLPPDSAAPERLHQAMRYAVLNGGKRIRPLLVSASAEALRLDPQEFDPCACAVELIHCYSLVHDDLPAMDDDDLRRGQPTLHRAYDEATAILAGDALLTLAFECLADSGAPAAVVGVMARACGSRGMVGGQMLDMAFESTRPSQEQLETMFRLKTGALIRAAVEMPAAYAHNPQDPVRRALGTYADSIGLAFQIIDDLLDIEGSTEEIGKPAGSDLVRDKATWPMLFGVDAARARADALLAEAWDALEELPGDTSGLRWLGERIVQRRS